MIKKLIKLSVLLALNSISINAFAENVWLRAFPAAYNVFTGQQIEALSDFHVKIYNPTDAVINAHYRAYVCAEGYENQCVSQEITEKVDPKKWLDHEFKLIYPVTYYTSGIYKVTASVEGDGTEHATYTDYGSISVYPKSQW